MWPIKTKPYFLLLVVTAAICLCSRVHAQSPSFTGDPYATATNPNYTLGSPGQDYNYVERGLEDVNAAVVFSKLALTKSGDAAVKSLAQSAVDKHILIGGGLVQDAKGMKLPVPKGLNASYSAQYQDLSKLSGEDFDKAYLEALIKLQHDGYANMLDESKASKVPRLQAESDKNLGTIAQLNDQASKLLKKLNGAK
jgi:putative membrane protein